MTKFKVGDRVAFVDEKMSYSEGGEPPYGTVKSITNGIYFVNWDYKNDYYNKVLKNSGDKYLKSEKEIKIEWSNLEDEYKVVADHAKEKVLQAVELIKEARLLAKKSNFELKRIYEAIDPLTIELENIGWNTSSFNC
jgi:hypothetical protein